MQIRLGEQIREQRCRNGRTQEDLAQALGVTPQAVSRWETDVCYPDMALIPSIANFFGVSIDELFGYQNERTKKVDALVEKISEMNRQNNGRDVCMDECIQLAREGMGEFPGNEKIMLCLASVLYNAGYVRYGEHHLTDEEGYDVYDVERHRTYTEWQEAIRLYEKLLTTLKEGDMRHQAVRELIQLYANTGEWEKAFAVSQTAPSLSGCRELLRLNACDGRKRAEAYGETLLDMVHTCSGLMVSAVMVNKGHIHPDAAVQTLENAIALYGLVCTDGNCGLYHAPIACLHLYLSEHLWLAGNRDGAFEALDRALEHAKKYESIAGQKDAAYTAPLLRLVKIGLNDQKDEFVAELPALWPWWFVPDCSKVKTEIQADPRWAEWVKKTEG